MDAHKTKPDITVFKKRRTSQ